MSESGGRGRRRFLVAAAGVATGSIATAGCLGRDAGTETASPTDTVGQPTPTPTPRDDGAATPVPEQTESTPACTAPAVDESRTVCGQFGRELEHLVPHDVAGTPMVVQFRRPCEWTDRADYTTGRSDGAFRMRFVREIEMRGTNYSLGLTFATTLSPVSREEFVGNAVESGWNRLKTTLYDEEWVGAMTPRPDDGVNKDVILRAALPVDGDTDTRHGLTVRAAGDSEAACVRWRYDFVETVFGALRPNPESTL